MFTTSGDEDMLIFDGHHSAFHIKITLYLVIADHMFSNLLHFPQNKPFQNKHLRGDIFLGKSLFYFNLQTHISVATLSPYIFTIS